eukprot:COSAG02_NODE_54_length_43941_cov_54.857990_43_plen_123_part_00
MPLLPPVTTAQRFSLPTMACPTTGLTGRGVYGMHRPRRRQRARARARARGRGRATTISRICFLCTRVIWVWLSTIIYEFIYELPSVCMGNSYINSYIIVDSHTQMTLVCLLSDLFILYTQGF